MRRLLIGLCVMAVVALAASAAGLELGPRRGSDAGWSDCKFDAKETVHPVNDDTFWKWQGSTNSVIRKHRSFFE